jgi:hypothetical protein
MVSTAIEAPADIRRCLYCCIARIGACYGKRMTGRTALLACTGITLALSACASGAGGYPSLALRNTERMHASAMPVEAEAVPAETPAQPEPGLAAALARLAGQADESHRRFESQRGRTMALVGSARGAAMASDAWSVASIALATLHTARGQTSLSLSELESLDIADRASNPNGETRNSAALASARQRIEALVTDEDRTLAALGSQLRN